MATKGKIKDCNANKLIKAKPANYSPCLLTNIVRKVTIAKPKHDTSTSASSEGHSPAAKISRNSRKMFRKRELRRAFAAIDKGFEETGARLDAELKTILSYNDSVFEAILSILDKEEDEAGTAESAILDSAATPLYCSTRSNLKKTGRKSDRIFQVPTGQVAEAGEERMAPRFAGAGKSSTQSTRNGTKSVDEHAKVGRRLIHVNYNKT